VVPALPMQDAAACAELPPPVADAVVITMPPPVAPEPKPVAVAKAPGAEAELCAR
jgi:hypothetical protein